MVVDFGTVGKGEGSGGGVAVGVCVCVCFQYEKSRESFIDVALLTSSTSFSSNYCFPVICDFVFFIVIPPLNS